ncbi:MAG: hypothetical protein ACJA2S_004936, partial [Cyclobacteriaceae bacterium]
PSCFDLIKAVALSMDSLFIEFAYLKMEDI